MAIQFIKQPPATLNVKTGKTTGLQKPQQPADVGMPTEELHKQAIELFNNKVPLEKALMAVLKHEDITDKQKAQEMVKAVYTILDDSKKV